jgi:membrane-associated phospholipid phosphatase
VLRELDVGLLRLLRTRGHAPPVEAGVVLLARLGEHGVIWYALAAIAAALDRERRPVYARATRAVFAATIANALIKRLIRRTRPMLEGLPALTPTLSGLTYPSAHASTSFAGARVLSEALPTGAMYGLGSAMALSRPYLGVHYPSDIVAGALLGDAVAKLTP